jgi:hypothetical protein
VAPFLMRDPCTSGSDASGIGALSGASGIGALSGASGIGALSGASGIGADGVARPASAH